LVSLGPDHYLCLCLFFGCVLVYTAQIEDLAASRPRRGKPERRGGGVGGVASPGPGGTPTAGAGAGGPLAGKRAQAGGWAVPLRFEPGSTEALLSRPFAPLALEDLTVYKASLSGGAAAAAAQLSQLTGGAGGDRASGKVSKGREVSWGRGCGVGGGGCGGCGCECECECECGRTRSTAPRGASMFLPRDLHPQAPACLFFFLRTATTSTLGVVVFNPITGCDLEPVEPCVRGWLVHGRGR
jgi:hypothetical protein